MTGHPYKSRPTAGTHVWLTPKTMKDQLGEFDLDPCAAPLPRPWDTARHHITLPDDGLAVPWFGRVWCNPPFGAALGVWLERMAQHNHGTALSFARTETQAFRSWVWGAASGILFLYGRPKFALPSGEEAKGNSGGPICLIAYGRADADHLTKLAHMGKYLGVNP